VCALELGLGWPEVASRALVLLEMAK